MHNGKPLFQKEGDKEKWLLFSKIGSWMIAATSSKDANDGKGWCKTVVKGSAHPVEAKAWQVCTGSEPPGWEDQAGVAAVPTVRFT